MVYIEAQGQEIAAPDSGFTLYLYKYVSKFVPVLTVAKALYNVERLASHVCVKFTAVFMRQTHGDLVMVFALFLILAVRKDPLGQHLWIKLVNRKQIAGGKCVENWEPPKYSRICSTQFVALAQDTTTGLFSSYAANTRVTKSSFLFKKCVKLQFPRGCEKRLSSNSEIKMKEKLGFGLLYMHMWDYFL